MLDFRPFCEHCGKGLPSSSKEAMICSFECTYCQDCAISLFKNVCPSCGGNFEKRPIRPSRFLRRYPPSNEHMAVPNSGPEVASRIAKFKNIKPEER